MEWSTRVILGFQENENKEGPRCVGMVGLVEHEQKTEFRLEPLAPANSRNLSQSQQNGSHITSDIECSVSIRRTRDRTRGMTDLEPNLPQLFRVEDHPPVKHERRLVHRAIDI